MSTSFGLQWTFFTFQANLVLFSRGFIFACSWFDFYLPSFLHNQNRDKCYGQREDHNDKVSSGEGGECQAIDCSKHAVRHQRDERLPNTNHSKNLPNLSGVHLLAQLGPDTDSGDRVHLYDG